MLNRRRQRRAARGGNRRTPTESEPQVASRPAPPRRFVLTIVHRGHQRADFFSRSLPRSPRRARARTTTIVTADTHSSSTGPEET